MKRFVLLAALCAALLSCTQEATLTLSADVPTAQFGPEGGSFNTILFTNGSEWTAECDDPSITFSPASGSYTTPMHIEVGENTEHYTKVVRITVVSKLDSYSRQYYLVVTQACHPFVICDEASKTIGAAGGTVRFSVNSDKGWVVYKTLLDGADTPLSVTPDNHGENIVTVEVNVPAIESGKSRTWEILLASKATPSVKACRLTIVQKP